jgi:hypothetical protein
MLEYKQFLFESSKVKNIILNKEYYNFFKTKHKEEIIKSAF